MTPAAPLLCFLAVAVATQSAPAAAQRSAVVGAWTEAVVSVRDPASAAKFFIQSSGWRVVARGSVAQRELAFWRLPPTARARFLKICAAKARDGCIRFVAFSGVPQRPVRLGARPWDTGGIFSLMLRSTDVRATFADAIASGWTAESEPYRLDFGGSELWNVVLTSPQGFNIALYERVSPPFIAYPLAPLSRAFNAMRMVRDQRAAVGFYAKLGFSQAFDADFVDPRPGPNNFSIPVNYATRIVRRASAMYPVAGETGRIEVMQFVGFEGKDQSAHASPPNLGILSLRFPVDDLAAYRTMLATRGVTIAYSASAVPVAGLGLIDLIAVRDPDGNLSEFYAEAR